MDATAAGSVDELRLGITGIEVPDWPAWDLGRRPKDLLNDAIRAVQKCRKLLPESKRKAIPRIYGTMINNPHEWGAFLMNALAQDPAVRLRLQALPFAVRLRELLGPG